MGDELEHAEEELRTVRWRRDFTGEVYISMDDLTAFLAHCAETTRAHGNEVGAVALEWAAMKLDMTDALPPMPGPPPGRPWWSA